MAKEVVAKAIDFRNGELSVFARTGADVRIHLSDDQLAWLAPKIAEELARKVAA